MQPTSHADECVQGLRNFGSLTKGRLQPSDFSLEEVNDMSLANFFRGCRSIRGSEGGSRGPSPTLAFGLASGLRSMDDPPRIPVCRER